MKKLFLVVALVFVIAIPVAHNFKLNKAHACGGVCTAALFVAINAARVAVRLLARTLRSSPRLEKIRQNRNRKCRTLYSAYKKVGGSGRKCYDFRARSRDRGGALKAHCATLKVIRSLKKAELTGRLAYEKLCSKRTSSHAHWNRQLRKGAADCTTIIRRTCR